MACPNCEAVWYPPRTPGFQICLCFVWFWYRPIEDGQPNLAIWIRSRRAAKSVLPAPLDMARAVSRLLLRLVKDFNGLLPHSHRVLGIVAPAQLHQDPVRVDGQPADVSSVDPL